MKDCERIRDERSDITDYVVHLTRADIRKRKDKVTVARGFTVLKEILAAGVLKPTFAPGTTRYPNRNLTIRGPYRAVCFTEQPLSQLLVTLWQTHRYEGYGIAMNKVEDYVRCARPTPRIRRQAPLARSLRWEGNIQCLRNDFSNRAAEFEVEAFAARDFHGVGVEAQLGQDRCVDVSDVVWVLVGKHA